MDIKPLPSRYKHTVFRSRLEARWAIYFDLIGCKWEYEPEGYKLPSGNYCPDFLCNDAFFVEIKPNREQINAYAVKLSQLAKMTGRNVIGIAGPPSLNSHRTWIGLGEGYVDPAAGGLVLTGEAGNESCGSVFTRRAFEKWGEPYFSDDDIAPEDPSYEPYADIACGVRFENGRADVSQLPECCH